MTPHNVISWTLTFALVWVIIVCLMPIDHWIETFAQRRLRHKNLERRIEELEQKIKELQIEKVVDAAES